MADHTGYSDNDAKPELTSNNVGETGNSLHNNKRKRDSLDHSAVTSRPAPGDSGRGASSYRRVSPGSANNTSSGTQELNEQTAAAFLAAHNASGSNDMDHSSNNIDFSALAQHAGDHNLHQNGGAAETAGAALHYSMTVPTATELSFQSQASTGEGERQLGASFGMSDHSVQQHHGLPDFSGLEALKGGSQPPSSAAENQSPPNATPHKPPVGSEEWHKVRRDNHKEVERRRRETINEGINELAKIVPGCEKNKGSILQRAVQFITQLKENESQNIEKWTLEKLLTEQAITELSASCEKFKAEMQRAWDECEIWKRACQANGIVPEEFKDQGDASNQNGES